MTPSTSRYDQLDKEVLARLVPELLLIGHLIDRAGMPWVVSTFGQEAMTHIAIEEWAAASPIYTRRMQHALGYAPDVPGGGDVVTIFKGLQFDIGAPPQFMDFRYKVEDRHRGEFHLAHCGALMDVEPMGEVFVRAMCHDIEDPTFDATAVASNPKARVRPIHRPPRVPADRHPHCAWTVVIDDAHSEAVEIPALELNRRSRAATIDLAPIDPADEGFSDYTGALLSDIDFERFSKSALTRIADEVCLQMHLLDRGFTMAIAERADSPDQIEAVRRRQLIGFAGLAAERLAKVLNLSSAPDQVRQSAIRLLALHPLLNPSAYVTASIYETSIVVHPSPAHEDNAWIALCGPTWTAPLQAIVRALDPHLDVQVAPYPHAGIDAWSIGVVTRRQEALEAEEVAVAKFSTGASFKFEERASIPLDAPGTPLKSTRADTAQSS